MRAQARIDMSTEGVPLTLAPLLSAYGRHRRILLRVENLPERARLSRGRNNGDRSWSLMRDELEDLVYLPPQGGDAAHTLAVRVINLEGDGETLALHELAIEPNGVQSRSGTKQAPSASVAELRKLREDLASTKTALKARERELASEQAQTARARADATRFEVALADARAEFDSEIKARLATAEAEAATRLDASRAAWAQEQNRRLQDIEARAQQRLDEARACWQQESEAAVANAKLDWKSSEAMRLAAAETQWRMEANRSLAEAEARFEQSLSASADARAQSSREVEKRAREEAEASLAKARDAWKAEEAAHLAAAEAKWRAESHRALAEAQARFEQAQSTSEGARAQSAREAEKRARGETESAVTRAKEAWKTEEAARLAQAEAAWRAQSDRAASEAARELEHLRSELAQTRASLGARERELAIVAAAAANAEASKGASDIAEAQKTWEAELAQRLAEADATAAGRLEAARVAWIKETQEKIAALDKKAGDRLQHLQNVWQAEAAAALAQASEAWSVEEAARRAASEAAWRAQSEQALERLRREQAESATHPGTESSELHRLGIELETLKAALAQRETELAAAQGELAQSREVWSAEEAARLAGAEARWREETEQAFERLRREKTEAGKQPRSESSELRRRDGDFEKLRSALAQRDNELATVRSDFLRARERWKADLQHTLEVSKQAWLAEEEQRLKIVRTEWEREQRAAQIPFEEIEDDAPRQRMRFLRDATVGVLLAATAVFVDLEIVPGVTANESQPTIPVTTGTVHPSLPASSAASPQILVVAHGVNLRTTASASAPILATLARGTRVAMIERQKDWTRVRLDTTAGKPDREGWVFGSYLKTDSGE